MPPKKAAQAPSHLSTLPMPLPSFLKMLNASGLSMTDSMSIASKMHGSYSALVDRLSSYSAAPLQPIPIPRSYKEYNTPAKLSTLTVPKLTALLIEDKDQRTKILAALRKAGYKITEPDVLLQAPEPELASSSKPTPRKRRRDDDLIRDAPPHTPEVGGSEYGSLDFGEIVDEEALMSRSAVINRAPVMAAWAIIVCERIGFKREEALSIGSAYTQMNATSKGISLGIFDESKQSESAVGSAQPYVTLMDRKPVMQLPNEEWRGLTRGQPVEPAAAFGYIHRAMRQTLPYVMGAMRLLSLSFDPQQLNDRGYGVYCEFRPEVDGWGNRAEMRMADILAQRPGNSITGPAGGPLTEPADGDAALRSTRVEHETASGHAPSEPARPRSTSPGAVGGIGAGNSPERPSPKRARRLTLEEYEDQGVEAAAPWATETELERPERR